jgi:hypothetical protein
MFKGSFQHSVSAPVDVVENERKLGVITLFWDMGDKKEEMLSRRNGAKGIRQ